MVGCLSFGTAVRAEDDAATRQAARKLAEDGVAALQNGDAATAVQKLEKAQQMLKAPSIALWSARALRKRGHLVEAAERLREALRLPSTGDAAVQEQAKREAETELAELTPRIPVLVIQIEGEEPQRVSVTLDGAPVPSALLGEERPINPGPHRVIATRGSEQTSADVTLAEAERQEAKLTFNAVTSTAKPVVVFSPPASETERAPDRTLAYVALGAGAAGLVLGGVTGALAIGKKSSLDDNPACQSDRCTRAAEDDVKSLRLFRTVSTIGFVAGGVLAATGVVLLVTAKPSPSQAATTPRRLSLGLGAGLVQLAGSF
jgi:hypothetical protein